MATAPRKPRRIAIVGGGIIGCSTAYYLTKLARGHTADELIMIEAVDIASQASGKAGGFLAKDWNKNATFKRLMEFSFNLHQELAKNFGEEAIGYRRVNALSVISKENENNSKINKSEEIVPKWLQCYKEIDEIGTIETTAQVHPKLLTRALFKASKIDKVVIGRQVVNVEFKGQTKVVILDNEDRIEADVLVVTTGPWSNSVPKWFPKAKFPKDFGGGNPCHSIVMDVSECSEAFPATAIFLNHYDIHHRCWVDPEIYPRPDKTVYVCGKLGDDERQSLPEHPKDVELNGTECAKLNEVVKVISPDYFAKGCPVMEEQVCFIPASPDGFPIIGPIPNYDDVFIGTGHTFWGILNGPSTGLMLAEMIHNLPISFAQSNAFNIKRFK